MSSKITQLYFVALIPPEPINRKITTLKEEMWEIFGSKAALKSPPHITLHMPFRFREDRESKVIESLIQAVRVQDPFEISLKGFGCFAPKVIYVGVERSEVLQQFRERLVRRMKAELQLYNADHKKHPFQPHMTIGFRDLSKTSFEKAWEYYAQQDFNFSWKCTQLSLLKHTGTQWVEHETFSFGSSSG